MHIQQTLTAKLFQCNLTFTFMQLSHSADSHGKAIPMQIDPRSASDRSLCRARGPWRSQVQELSGLRALGKVSLSRKWLGPLDGIVIAKLIMQNSSLVELDLSHNLLGQRNDAAIIALGEAFGKNPPALRRVNLAKNYVSFEGAKALSKALPTNNVLRELNLGQNEIDGPSAILLCQALLANQVR